MLKLRDRQLRKINTSHKVYVPENARDTQYIILEMSLNNDLIEKANDHQLPTEGFEGFYRFISNEFFKLCNRFGMYNVSLIANNKLIKVRYSEEIHIIETQKQILFLYNPNAHISLKSFYNPNKLSNKIQFLFLADGTSIRDTASQFHLNVLSLLGDLSSLMLTPIPEIKIKDHQHLTFDLFWINKNNKKTKTHGFRNLITRYYQESVVVPQNAKSLSYAIATLPINKTLLDNIAIDIASNSPYQGLYQFISIALLEASKEVNLKKVCMVANNKIPIVRHSDHGYTIIDDELIHLGFDFNSKDSIFNSFYDDKYLASNVYFVFIPTAADICKKSYGKFVNHVMESVNKTAKTLGYQEDKDLINFRFYQHLSYQHQIVS